MEKLECLFCLSFYRSDLLQTSAHNNSIWQAEQSAVGKEKKVRDYLVKLNVFTLVKLDEIHPRALIELSDVMVRLLPVIYRKTQRLASVHLSGVSKCYTYLKKGRREDVESYSGQPHLGPWKDHEACPPGINF